ncbi:hypothetical protein LZC95_08315 [Pendulispora brunnea]|uniref:Uncharacterized protein n=1 Tax=Pendulispora brunnea TaxID=2905690 RepID=A0ABZ2KE23_9BACT
MSGRLVLTDNGLRVLNGDVIPLAIWYRIAHKCMLERPHVLPNDVTVIVLALEGLRDKEPNERRAFVDAMRPVLSRFTLDEGLRLALEQIDRLTPGAQKGGYREPSIQRMRDDALDRLADLVVELVEEDPHATP